MKSTIIIGTRSSELALWQAEWVKTALIEKFPNLTVCLETIKTKGDKILDVPLAKVGGKGLFVKEIEEALLNRRVDLAVHSMKDMPAELPDGLHIGAIPDREIPNDVLISKQNLPLSRLLKGAKIGTSSLRRASQLLSFRPDFRIYPLRGNLGTRLKKLESEGLDAIVLAAAGVKRLNMEDRIAEYIDTDILLPAVGQGALCIESRKNDPDIHEMIANLNHPLTCQIVTAERAFLHRLEGGCQVPMAAYGILAQRELMLTGMVAEIDGTKIIRQSLCGPLGDAEKIGIELAQRLIAMGADKILDKVTRELNKNEA